MKILVARRRDAMILGGMLLVMAVIWMVPIVSALNRSLVFNGLENYTSLFSQPIGGITISLTVGWAWMIRWMSSALEENSMATTISPISSPAIGPMIWAPRIRSVVLSA